MFFGRYFSFIISFCLAYGDQVYHPVFHFKKTPSQVISDKFNMCFADDKLKCFEIEKSRFEFYSRSTVALHNKEINPTVAEDTTGIRSTIDSLIYKLLEQVEDKSDVECVPYVSTYTDCTKENICTGCRNCFCDDEAKWNCTLTQRCLPDAELIITPQTLKEAIENLSKEINIISNRVKRHIGNSPPKINNMPTEKMNYRTLVNWVYNTENLLEATKFRRKIVPTTERVNKLSTEHKLLSIQKTKTSANVPLSTEDIFANPDAYNLAFDEIMNVIYNDKMDKRHSDESDKYSDLMRDKIKKHQHNDFTDTLNALEDIDNVTDVGDKPANELFDLFENVKKIAMKKHSDGRIFKREVSQNVTSSPDNNTLAQPALNKFKEEVLYPITAVINNKQREIDELLRVRKKIVNFLIKCKDFDIHAPENATDSLNSPYLSIYKIGIESQPDSHGFTNRKDNHTIIETINNFGTNNSNIFRSLEIPGQDSYEHEDINIHHDSRTVYGKIKKYHTDLNPGYNSTFDKFLFKLKHDIYEVVKDIVVIQRYSNSPKLPKDLKILIRAMRNYVRTQANASELSNDAEDDLPKSNSIPDKPDIGSEVKPFLIKTLTVLKDVPKKDAINYLSFFAYKIINRIVKRYYVNEFDHRFNVSIANLRNVNALLMSALEEITDASDTNKLYKMKAIHIVLMSNIALIERELKVVKFAHNRRMNIGEVDLDVVARLKDSLSSCRRKFKNLIETETSTDNSVATGSWQDNHLNMKAMLKDSKNAIIQWIRKSMPSSYLSHKHRKSMRKPINKDNLYSVALNRWQKQIEDARRETRSEKRVKRDMRLVIPKYLQDKVYALNAKNNDQRRMKILKKLELMRKDLSSRKNLKSLLISINLQPTNNHGNTSVIRESYLVNDYQPQPQQQAQPKHPQPEAPPYFPPLKSPKLPFPQKNLQDSTETNNILTKYHKVKKGFLTQLDQWKKGLNDFISTVQHAPEKIRNTIKGLL